MQLVGGLPGLVLTIAPFAPGELLVTDVKQNRLDKLWCIWTVAAAE